MMEKLCAIRGSKYTLIFFKKDLMLFCVCLFCIRTSGFLTSALLTCWVRGFFVMSSCPVNCRISSSILDLYPLDTSYNPRFITNISGTVSVSWVGGRGIMTGQESLLQMNCLFNPQNKPMRQEFSLPPFCRCGKGGTNISLVKQTNS